MQWSKLKSRIKVLICPELKDRIDFHVTSYRRSHDGADKVWVTVDGGRVFACKHYRRDREMAELYSGGMPIESAKAFLRQVAIHGPGDFGDAMRAYLDLPIHDALESSDPLIKAFAIVDRRVGRKTIAKLDISASEHPLVRRFYELRRESMIIH